MKFPIYTNNQFFNIFHMLFFPAKTDKIIKLFPVNNSLPATRTIAIPAGNTIAPTSLATEATDILLAATVEPIPANPINIPAKNPSNIILKIGRLLLCIPISI